MRQILLGCMAAFLAASPAIAADKPPISLAMDGPWVANYDADSCQLMARFGSGSDAVTIRFTRYEPADGFDLALYGDVIDRADAFSRPRIAFGPGSETKSIWAAFGTLGGKPLLMFTSRRLDNWEKPLGSREVAPPEIGPDREAAVTDFTFQANRGPAYRLELGSMRRPMAEMRKCMDNLLVHWGYDPKVVASLSRPVTPIGNPGYWITSRDYPTGALKNRENGIVQFRLDVDETGKITACRILARSQPDKFAEVSCLALNRRARFLPALDASGRPVRGFWVNKVRFMTPSD